MTGIVEPVPPTDEDKAERFKREKKEYERRQWEDAKAAVALIVAFALFTEVIHQIMKFLFGDASIE